MRLVPSALAAAAAVSLLAACGAVGPGTAAPSSSAPAAVASPSASAPARTTYPVTVTDCGGRTTTYTKAPERVVTIDPNIAESLLMLGLGDRIVGLTQFYGPDQQWVPVKAEMATLPVINKDGAYPSKEAVVAAQPDLVTSIYPYAFMDPLPDREGWQKLGINTYESLGECDGAHATDFSLLYQDLRNLGVIFDVQQKAEVAVQELQTRVEAAQQKLAAAGVHPGVILTHDGTKEHPGAYGSTANAVITMAGGRYPFVDIPIDRAPTWEEFVAADPDVVWIIPDAGPSAAEVEAQLAADPRTKDLKAVRDKRYVVVPQADATVESPRDVDGFEAFVAGLLALR